jgi:hypothetical protein
LGKILLVVLDQREVLRLRPGMMIMFWVEREEQGMYTVEHAELLYVPSPTELSDMYWVSHLLELCYFFMPLRQPDDGYWAMLVNGFLLLDYRWYMDSAVWEQLKRLYTGAVLSYLGFLPPDGLIAGLHAIQPALERFIDFTHEQKVEFFNTCAKVVHGVPAVRLDQWLLHCLQTHPRAHMFKTVAFVYHSPTHEVR